MLVWTIDIAVADGSHRCSDEVDGVTVGITFIFEKLLLFRHPLTFKRAHVDPHTGEEMNHNSKWADWSYVACSILNFELFSIEDLFCE